MKALLIVSAGLMVAAVVTLVTRYRRNPEHYTSIRPPLHDRPAMLAGAAVTLYGLIITAVDGGLVMAIVPSIFAGLLVSSLVYAWRERRTGSTSASATNSTSTR